MSQTYNIIIYLSRAITSSQQRGAKKRIFAPRKARGLPRDQKKPFYGHGRRRSKTFAPSIQVARHCANARTLQQTAADRIVFYTTTRKIGRVYNGYEKANNRTGIAYIVIIIIIKTIYDKSMQIKKKTQQYE